MDWTEYETIREDLVFRIKNGLPIHQIQPIARTHASLFNHSIYYPSCSTTLLEMFFTIEEQYKKR